MTELMKGRPLNTADRIPAEAEAYDFLDRLSIEYYRVDHEPAMTMEICREIEKTLKAGICKNLFLCNRQETSFYLLLMPGEKKFKTKDLSAQLGVSRLSFASDINMQKYLGLTPGSVTVLGLMFDKEKNVRLVIDKDILDNPEIGIHPCINTTCVRLKTQDLIDKLIPATGHDYTVVNLPDYNE